MTSKIIKDMVGYYLDFNETAIANSILDSPSYQDVVAITEKVRPFIIDESIFNTLNCLIGKLLRTKHTSFEQLYILRENKQLYTYPPQMLDMEEY